MFVGIHVTCSVAVFLFARAFTGRASFGLLSALLAAAIAVRFMVFAMKAGDNSRERTRPYERFAAALRMANPRPKPGDVITVGPEAVYGIEDQYRDPAAQAVFCTPGLRVEIR